MFKSTKTKLGQCICEFGSKTEPLSVRFPAHDLHCGVLLDLELSEFARFCLSYGIKQKILDFVSALKQADITPSVIEEIKDYINNFSYQVSEKTYYKVSKSQVNSASDSDRAVLAKFGIAE